MDGLRKIVDEGTKLAEAGDEERAMSLANRAVEQFADSYGSWAFRAYLHGRCRNYNDAVVDLTRAIEINPEEPHLYFECALNRMVLGRDREAVLDLDEALRLCQVHASDYYREALRFMRSLALARTGRKSEAKRDLAEVSPEFSMWIDKLWTKGQVAQLCA
jgi:tetratricopeptide (TPR) repeat protein